MSWVWGLWGSGVLKIERGAWSVVASFSSDAVFLFVWSCFDPNSAVKLDAACRGTYHETRLRTLPNLQACTTALCGIPYARGPVADRTVQVFGECWSGRMRSVALGTGTGLGLRELQYYAGSRSTLSCQCEASGDISGRWSPERTIYGIACSMRYDRRRGVWSTWRGDSRSNSSSSKRTPREWQRNVAWFLLGFCLLVLSPRLPLLVFPSSSLLSPFPFLPRPYSGRLRLKLGREPRGVGV